MFEFLKRVFTKGSCPECGFIFACSDCSERYFAVDEELKKKEKR